MAPKREVTSPELFQTDGSEQIRHVKKEKAEKTVT